MSYFVGVDVGGTKILMALLDQQGNFLLEKRFLTRPERKPAEIIEEISLEIERMLQEFAVHSNSLTGVGLCIAGFYDWPAGIMKSSPNLPGWEMFPVQQEITKLLDCPVLVENDASAAAYGEYLFGAGQGVKDLVHLTLGTGIGAGLVLDGKLFRGSKGFAGELGHIPLLPGGPQCGCGRTGCFETLASGRALAREGNKILAEGQSTFLKTLVPNNNSVTASHIFIAAKQGDPAATEIIKNAAFYLGQGLSLVVNLLNPSRITLGGGLFKEDYLFFLEEAEQQMRQAAVTVSSEAVELARAQFIDEAGILGIFALLKEKYL